MKQRQQIVHCLNTELVWPLGLDAFKRCICPRCRLISAGPELLEALQGVLSGMPFGACWDSQGKNPQWLKDARKAVRLAK